MAIPVARRPAGLCGALGQQLFDSWGRMSGLRKGPEKDNSSFSFVLQMLKTQVTPTSSNDFADKILFSGL